MSCSSDEYCEDFEHGWRAAAMSLRCDACEIQIAIGDRYHWETWVFDGDDDASARCVRCQAIYEHLTERMRLGGDRDEFCAPALDCGDEYEERWDEPPPPEIAALAFWLPGDPLPGKT